MTYDLNQTFPLQLHAGDELCLRFVGGLEVKWVAPAPIVVNDVKHALRLLGT